MRSQELLHQKSPSIDLIRILSEGTYTPRFRRHSKENLFQIPTTRMRQMVALRFDDEFSTLSIRDNGEGMTSDDFTRVFASIARSGQKVPPTPEAQRLSRERIARFGIGALKEVGRDRRRVYDSIS